MAHDGDGIGWDVTAPANADVLSLGALEIRDLRIGVGNREAMEHVKDASAKAGGEHLSGSAKAFYQSAAPSERPDGVNNPWGDGATSLVSTGDDGRLWVDSDNKVLYVWYGNAFGLVQVIAGNIAADAVTTVKILDNNVTLAKIADLSAQGNLIRGGAAGAVGQFAAKTSGNIVLGDGTDVISAAMSGGATISAAGVVTLHTPYVKLADVKTENTNGGTFTAGSWTKRTVAEIDDVSTICAVSSSVFVLDAGTYRCRISCPACRVNMHQARLRNTTGSTTLLSGTTVSSPTGAVTNSPSIIVGRFTVAAAQNLEIQHYCKSTRDDIGFGSPADITAASEVYTVAEFWKEVD